MTYALREARSQAAHALAASIAQVMARITLAALELSGDSVHEPVHASAPTDQPDPPGTAVRCCALPPSSAPDYPARQPESRQSCRRLDSPNLDPGWHSPGVRGHPGRQSRTGQNPAAHCAPAAIGRSNVPGSTDPTTGRSGRARARTLRAAGRISPQAVPGCQAPGLRSQTLLHEGAERLLGLPHVGHVQAVVGEPGQVELASSASRARPGRRSRPCRSHCAGRSGARSSSAG